MAALLKEARILANYISELKFHDFSYTPPMPYNHIGALFTDVILQAGLNYKYVVLPRVARIFRLFPDARTVSAFQKIIENHGLSYVLNWKNNIKGERFSCLMNLVITKEIDTEEEFKEFLLEKENQKLLLSLKGIGPKTLDYTLKLLCVDSIAVDRHILNFVNNAGINRCEYYEVKTIVEYAADLLQSPRMKLDSFIWLTMSSQNTFQQKLKFL